MEYLMDHEDVNDVYDVDDLIFTNEPYEPSEK